MSRWDAEGDSWVKDLGTFLRPILYAYLATSLAGGLWDWAAPHLWEGAAEADRWEVLKAGLVVALFVYFAASVARLRKYRSEEK